MSSSAPYLVAAIYLSARWRPSSVLPHLDLSLHTPHLTRLYSLDVTQQNLKSCVYKDKTRGNESCKDERLQVQKSEEGALLTTRLVFSIHPRVFHRRPHPLDILLHIVTEELSSFGIRGTASELVSFGESSSRG